MEQSKSDLFLISSCLFLYYCHLSFIIQVMCYLFLSCFLSLHRVAWRRGQRSQASLYLSYRVKYKDGPLFHFLFLSPCLVLFFIFSLCSPWTIYFFSILLWPTLMMSAPSVNREGLHQYLPLYFGCRLKLCISGWILTWIPLGASNSILQSWAQPLLSRSSFSSSTNGITFQLAST